MMPTTREASNLRERAEERPRAQELQLFNHLQQRFKCTAAIAFRHRTKLVRFHPATNRLSCSLPMRTFRQIASVFSAALLLCAPLLAQTPATAQSAAATEHPNPASQKRQSAGQSRSGWTPRGSAGGLSGGCSAGAAGHSHRRTCSGRCAPAGACPYRGRRA